MPGGGGIDRPDEVGRYLREIAKTPLLTAEQEVALAKRIEAGVYAAELLRRAHTAGPRPTVRRRRDLELVARDGREAKDAMIRANLRLVVSVAVAHRRRGLPLMDVIQDGNLGLIRAVEKFDYRKGYKFSTYAMWWIRQAIDRGAAVETRTVRVPVHVVEQVSKLERVERDLYTGLDHEPTMADVAEAAHLPVRRVRELRRIGRPTISLDTPVNDESDENLADLLVETSAPPTSELVESRVLAGCVRRMLDRLPAPAAMVVTLRYGLRDGQPRCRREIAEKTGLSIKRVRDLEADGLARLRRSEGRDALLDWAG